MKTTLVAFVALSVVLTVPSCRPSGKLTSEGAQAAIEKFVSRKGNRGTLRTHGGVREISSENRAVIDLEVENYFCIDQTCFSPEHSGVAGFSHYTDGKWALTEVTMSSGHTFKANIEVP